ncbi:hypothetical protein QTP70_003775 [Hemibagrus guttatus]|uniref:Protein MMS22-like n=1 Tax=Hemibagrus guttatus TaxID=175788 RepID=A0AAE0Q3P8_9TELE|nr:hypothetical protein QTP70_003775 [Hemibagrus guttatus]
MPRSKESQKQMRKKVIEIYQSGNGYKAISKALGLPRTTTRAIIYKWRKHGTVENLLRSGRLTKITPRAQRQLIQEVTKDPTTTSKELQASLASVKAEFGVRYLHTHAHYERFRSAGLQCSVESCVLSALPSNMEDDFSQSLTPPVSPFMDEELGDSSLARPPCFSCAFEKGKEDAQTLSSDGYVSRGVLKRYQNICKLICCSVHYGLLLKLDPAPADFEVDTADLFGFSWVTETALLESTQLLFGLFRQKVFRLETLVQSSSHDFGQASSLHYEAEELRQQCVQFLTYIKVFTHRYVEAPNPPAEEFSSSFSQMEAQFPSTLVEQLFGVMLLIGRLKDLPANVQSAFTIHHQGKLFPPSWHLLHLYLDVHWAILEILHILGQKMAGQVVYAHQFVDLTGETLTNISLFEDHLNNLLCDLITLSMNKYSKSFWGYVNALLNSMLKGAPSGAATHCKDVPGFTWWLITHFAQLGMCNHNGVLQNEAGVQEEQMRMYVHCCLTLSMVWAPSLSAINTLWDFFSKNMNGSFSVPWLGVSGLASIGSTPLALLEQAKSCCSPAPLNSTNHTNLYRSNNSFLIFLRMLALHLKQENGAPWRQIKGRIYSKFHERRMAELSETGLHHFLLLFLVLSLCADLEDATGHAFDLLALRLPAATAVMSWRGRLALLLGFVERGVDLGGVASRISASFSSAAREFYLKTTPVPRRAELWRLISAYLEGVGQVWQSSATLCLSEEKLINEGFDLLLHACGAKELDAVFDFLQVALTQLRRVQQCSQCASTALPLSVVKERHLAVAVTLWTHFLPFLRQISQTPPEELAHAAAGFTLLAMDLPNSAPRDLQPRPLLAMIQFFGWDETLRPLLVTRYLNTLLQNEELVRKMSSAGDSAQALCVRAWIRCILLQHQHNNIDTHNSRADRTLEVQLAEMTALILRLPEVESLLQRAGIDTNTATQEPKAALTLFIKCVGRVYCRLQQQAERVSLVCKALEYVGDIIKFIKPNLQKKSTEGLHITYWTLGCMVKHWSPILAMSKGQSLLLRIIDVLLLPLSLLQDKAPPSQLLLSAIQDTLPLYLQGLSVAVGVSQTQVSYLKQQLRSVITQYLSRFLPAAPTVGAVANHPVLLAGCEATPTPRGAALRRTILQAVKENFMQFRGHAPPPRLAAVLMFLLELLRRNNDTDPALLTVPLTHVLRCMMLVNEPQVKKLSTEIVQLIVERCSSAAREEPCEQLVTVLRTFVEENEGVYEMQMYSALETVAVLSPSAVSALIPVLSQSLHNTEQKRGIGKNTSLRTLNFIPDRSRPGLTTTAIGTVDLQGAGGNWATVGRRSRGGRRVRRQREKRKGKSVGLRIGTLNVGTMTGKGRELADMMERRKVDILCVQETRWKGSKARSIGAGFKLFYYGVDSKRNGVGVVLKEEFVRNVLEVKRVSDRVMSLKLEIEGVMLNVVSGYAPQVGCELEEKERFWSELDEVMESIPTGERVVIGADFNGHVGEGNRGDEEVMGKSGVKERNLEGQMVVDFAKRMDMAVVNTYFQKREEHRVGTHR